MRGLRRRAASHYWPTADRLIQSPPWLTGGRFKPASARPRPASIRPRNCRSYTNARATRWSRGNSARSKKKTDAPTKPQSGMPLLLSAFAAPSGRRRHKKRWCVLASRFPPRLLERLPSLTRQPLPVQSNQPNNLPAIFQWKVRRSLPKNFTSRNRPSPLAKFPKKSPLPVNLLLRRSPRRPQPQRPTAARSGVAAGVADVVVTARTPGVHLYLRVLSPAPPPLLMLGRSRCKRRHRSCAR